MQRSYLIGIAAAVLVLVIGVSLWFSGGDEEVQPACYAEAHLTEPLQLVGLWDNELMDSLGNLDLFKQNCSEFKDDTDRLMCIYDQLRLRERFIPVYPEPDRKSEAMGMLVIEAKPGRGLRAEYFDFETSHYIPFTPDLFEADWSYGPYFHQTLLTTQGDWGLLPKDPLAKEGWIEVKNLPDRFQFKQGDTVWFEDKTHIINAVGERSAVLQEVLESSNECDGEGDVLGEAKMYNWCDLYDESGHLKLTVRYPRGC